MEFLPRVCPAQWSIKGRAAALGHGAEHGSGEGDGSERPCQAGEELPGPLAGSAGPRAVPPEQTLGLRAVTLASPQMSLKGYPPLPRPRVLGPAAHWNSLRRGKRSKQKTKLRSHNWRCWCHGSGARAKLPTRFQHADLGQPRGLRGGQGFQASSSPGSGTR